MISPERCVFCRPEELAERRIGTYGLATAILSNPRLAPGHTLVIPNRHIEEPSQLTNQEMLAVFGVAIAIRNKLLATVARGVDIWQKSRPDDPENGIRMDHLHVHVIPSNPGEDLYNVLDWRDFQFEPLDDDERDLFLALLSDDVQ